jgi:hypothetical protein
MTLPPASDDSDFASQHSEDVIGDFYEWMHVEGRFLGQSGQASALSYLRYFERIAEGNDGLARLDGLVTARRWLDLMAAAQPDPEEVAALVRIAHVNAFAGTGWNNLAVLIRAWAENQGYPTPRNFFDLEAYRRRGLIQDMAAHFPELRRELEESAGRLDAQMSVLAEAVRAGLKTGDPALLPSRVVIYLDAALQQLEQLPHEPGVLSAVTNAVATSFVTADELRQSPGGQSLLRRMPVRVRKMLRDRESRWWKFWQ